MGSFQAQGATSFSLAAVPPFRLDLTVWALRRRPENQMDRWDGNAFRKVLLLDGKPAELIVTQIGSPSSPRIKATVTGVPLNSQVKSSVTEVLNRTLGLQIDLNGFYRFAANDPRVARLAKRFGGLKPPRFPSLFEALLNGIACQQFSLASGIQMLNRFCEKFGLPLKRAVAGGRTFPRPEDIAVLKSERLRSLGFNRQKARAIIELSRAIIDRQLDAAELAASEDEAAVERLCGLHGVGRWTAEYVLLRGLGRLNIFPVDDVGARNTLQRWLGIDQPFDYNVAQRLLAKWKPYTGMIYFHMLLYRLQQSAYQPLDESEGAA